MFVDVSGHGSRCGVVLPRIYGDPLSKTHPFAGRRLDSKRKCQEAVQTMFTFTVGMTHMLANPC